MSSMNDWWAIAVLLGSGVMIGVIFMMLDKYVFALGYRPYLNSTKPRVQTRSLLFLVAYWPLTIYVLTSSTFLIGQGFIVGVGAVLGLEMWQRMTDITHFKTYFQIPANSKLNQAEITYLTYAWIAVLLVATVLVVV